MKRDRLLGAADWVIDLVGRRGLATAAHLARESLGSLWRSRMLSVFAVSIIALSLATVGGFLLISHNLERVLERFRGAEFSLYLRDDASDFQREELEAVLRTTPEIVGLEYVGKQQALERFEQLHPTLADAPALLGENPFPASWEIKLSEIASEPGELRRLAESLGQLAAVESVGLDQELVERLGTARGVLRVTGLFFGGILVLASLFTVANVVKLTAYTHIDEIEIMKLVGATSAFVRGKYVIEGLLQGLAGGLFGVALLWLGHRAALLYLGSGKLGFLQSLTASFVPAWTLWLLVVAASLLGLVGALLSVGRYVRL